MPSLRKHAPDLEHLVEAAHHQALQVELGRHPQEEVDVERVVVRDERPRRGARRRSGAAAASPPRRSPASHRRSRMWRTTSLRSCSSSPAALVGPQVDLALAVARLGVGHAAPLVAEVAPRLGQQLPLGHLHRELAPLGAHHLAPRPDPVAQVELGRTRRSAARHRRQGEQLHRARVVAQLGEGQLALRPREHDAAGHPDGDAGLLARARAPTTPRPPRPRRGCARSGRGCRSGAPCRRSLTS